MLLLVSGMYFPVPYRRIFKTDLILAHQFLVVLHVQHSWSLTVTFPESACDHGNNSGNKCICNSKNALSQLVPVGARDLDLVVYR
jgi:hypothetical protein